MLPDINNGYINLNTYSYKNLGTVNTHEGDITSELHSLWSIAAAIAL